MKKFDLFTALAYIIFGALVVLYFILIPILADFNLLGLSIPSNRDTTTYTTTITKEGITYDKAD